MCVSVYVCVTECDQVQQHPSTPTVSRYKEARLRKKERNKQRNKQTNARNQIITHTVNMQNIIYNRSA